MDQNRPIPQMRGSGRGHRTHRVDLNSLFSEWQLSQHDSFENPKSFYLIVNEAKNQMVEMFKHFTISKFCSITVDRLEAGVERGSVRQSSLTERTRKGLRQLDERWNRFQRQLWGNISETGWSAYGLLPVHGDPPKLN